LSRLPDDTILDIETVERLALPTRANNVLINDYLGVTVGELRIDLTRRLARIRGCGKATRGIILSTIDGVPAPITQQALDRQIARIRREADARVAQLRAGAAEQLGLGWRP
jgi:hypothetical protein